MVTVGKVADIALKLALASVEDSVLLAATSIAFQKLLIPTLHTLL